MQSSGSRRSNLSDVERTMAQPFTLVGLDIEGDWNRPLLCNAAALSGCECVFARSGTGEGNGTSQSALESVALEKALQGCSQVLACESTRNSVSVYDFPAPRERTAILVGNEEQGIPRPVLQQVDRVVAVPMVAGGLSSLNVAVAAAVILYALAHDFARRRRVQKGLRQQNVDVLIAAPSDPHELGSLLRSVYAFGWRRVFLSDPHKVWFSTDPEVILKSRAAARRTKNLLAVIPGENLELPRYDAMLVCDQDQEGLPVSRLRLPECRRLLLVFGSWGERGDVGPPLTRVAVDHAARAVRARFRHDGSILLSVISEMLCA